MALNEVYPPQPKTKDVYVGVTTVRPGDVVVVGGFIGVAQNSSDGGAFLAAAGTFGSRIPHPIAGETIQDNPPYQAANWCTIAVSGTHSLTVVVTTAAMNFGDPVYRKTSDGSLTNQSASAVLIGYLEQQTLAIGTAKAQVAIACPIA